MLRSGTLLPRTGKTQVQSGDGEGYDGFGLAHPQITASCGKRCNNSDIWWTSNFWRSIYVPSCGEGPGSPKAKSIWREKHVNQIEGFAMTELEIEYLPTRALRPYLQLAIDVMLLLFGMGWLRNGILRSVGVIALHDEDKIFAEVQVGLI
jgi:hypothetical protein